MNCYISKINSIVYLAMPLLNVAFVSKGYQALQTSRKFFDAISQLFYEDKITLYFALLLVVGAEIDA